MPATELDRTPNRDAGNGSIIDARYSAKNLSFSGVEHGACNLIFRDMKDLFDNGSSDLRATTGRARACNRVQVRPLAIASCLVVMSQVAVAGESGHTRDIAASMQQPACEYLQATGTSPAPLRLAIHVNREDVEGEESDENSQGNGQTDGESKAGKGGRSNDDSEAPEQSSGGDAA